MPDSRPAPSTDIPPPSGGNIPPPAEPNPPPASTNALGNTTPTTTATPDSSLTGVSNAKSGSAIKSITDAVSNVGANVTPLQVFSIILIIVWVLFGLAGFVMSLWCIGFTGNFGEKFIGVIIAILLGPWYWLYFYSVPSYCARLPPPSFF